MLLPKKTGPMITRGAGYVIRLRFYILSRKLSPASPSDNICAAALLSGPGSPSIIGNYKASGMVRNGNGYSSSYRQPGNKSTPKRPDGAGPCGRRNRQSQRGSG